MRPVHRVRLIAIGAALVGAAALSASFAGASGATGGGITTCANAIRAPNGSNEVVVACGTNGGGTLNP